MSGHRAWTPTGRNHFSGPSVLKPKNERIKPHYVLFLFRTNINFKFEWVSESCSVVSDSLRPHGLYSPWNSPGQNTGVGNLFLLQGSSQPRDRTQLSHVAGGFFTVWATREAPESPLNGNSMCTNKTPCETRKWPHGKIFHLITTLTSWESASLLEGELCGVSSGFLWTILPAFSRVTPWILPLSSLPPLLSIGFPLLKRLETYHLPRSGFSSFMIPSLRSLSWLSGTWD